MGTFRDGPGCWEEEKLQGRGEPGRPLLGVGGSRRGTLVDGTKVPAVEVDRGVCSGWSGGVEGQGPL